MEREINSTFYDKYHKVTLRVVAGSDDDCEGCFYDTSNKCSDNRNIAGKCGGRDDKKSAIFIRQT